MVPSGHAFSNGTVGAVFGFPVFRASCAFRAVGAGRDGNQVLRIIEVPGDELPRYAAVAVGERLDDQC